MGSHVGMSVDRSAVKLDSIEARARIRQAAPRTTAVWGRLFDFVRAFVRETIAPGGLLGIVMALVFVLITDAVLMLMRSIQELPPVALTFLIPIVVAAIRWGTLSAAVTALGGAASVIYFFYSPFYSFSTAVALPRARHHRLSWRVAGARLSGVADAP